ncbi:hypothetical protein CR513_34334, partial [Mucuna pruriens]
MFAWSPTDMPDIDSDFLCHRLSISLGVHLVSQKKRWLGEEKKRAVKAETTKKPSGKWRICTYYTDLNKACRKDPYPLLSIDALVDGASICDLLNFKDAYSGYN